MRNMRGNGISRTIYHSSTNDISLVHELYLYETWLLRTSDVYVTHDCWVVSCLRRTCHVILICYSSRTISTRHERYLHDISLVHELYLRKTCLFTHGDEWCHVYVRCHFWWCLMWYWYTTRPRTISTRTRPRTVFTLDMTLGDDVMFMWDVTFGDVSCDIEISLVTNYIYVRYDSWTMSHVLQSVAEISSHVTWYD